MNLPFWQNLFNFSNDNPINSWMSFGSFGNNYSSPNRFVLFDYNGTKPYYGDSFGSYNGGSGNYNSSYGAYNTGATNSYGFDFGRYQTRGKWNIGLNNWQINNTAYQPVAFAYNPSVKSSQSPEKVDKVKPSDNNPTDEKVTGTRQLYNSLGLEKEGLSFEVFSLAMEGYNKLKTKGNGKLGIVDPNTKRYYLIDLNNSKFVEKTDVKFGSGRMDDVANANRDGSHATLSGFTQVKEEYASTKSHWSSRAKRLDGLETGINNNARSKHVVIHSTPNNTTWGCIGFTPVMRNGQQDDTATNEKMRRLFPQDTIIFTYPTDVDEYKSLSTLV